MPTSVNVRDTSSVVFALTVRTNTSVFPLVSVSSSDRFVARVANATTFPSADIRGTNAPPAEFGITPSAPSPRLISTFVVPLCTSRR